MERREIMIFKIRLPILDNLLGIINDDPERNNVGRPKERLDPGSGGGFIYHVCTCICHDASYLDGTFYGMFGG
jgi:ABC-type uncharacterized transport system YnjBCD substrate-binding protein